MKNVVAKIIFAFVFSMLLVSTVYCAPAGMAYREEREAVLRQTDCQAPEGAVVHDVWLEAAPMSGLITKVNVEPGEYVRVILVCAGGTGYEWQLTESKVSFLETVKSQVLAFPKSEQITGGKVAYIFLYKASAAATSTDRLAFVLYRSWEGVQKGVSIVEVNVQYMTGKENKYQF